MVKAVVLQTASRAEQGCINSTLTDHIQVRIAPVGSATFCHIRGLNNLKHTDLGLAFHLYGCL